MEVLGHIAAFSVVAKMDNIFIPVQMDINIVKVFIKLKLRKLKSIKGILFFYIQIFTDCLNDCLVCSDSSNCSQCNETSGYSL